MINRKFNRENDKPANYRIKAYKVICIDEGGNNLGVLLRDDAILKAKESSLDLVFISEGKDGIPVCRILDYGKFKYEQAKKQKESAKKQRESVIKTKELKLRPTTDINDLKTKANKAIEFLNDGDRIKVFIVFKGREITHKDVGLETLNKFMSMVPFAEYLDPPILQGKFLSVVISKKKDRQHDNNR